MASIKTFPVMSISHRRFEKVLSNPRLFDLWVYREQTGGWDSDKVTMTILARWRRSQGPYLG